LVYSFEIPENFSFKACLGFLDRKFDDITHKITQEKVYRIFKNDYNHALVCFYEENNLLKFEILQGNLSHSESLEILNQYLDFGSDLKPFYAALQNDTELSFLATKYHGLRAVGIPDLFETICWSIIGQQINLTFAYKLKKALVEHCDTHISFQGNKFFRFPEPQEILDLPDQVFSTIQFSKQKTHYIKNIAEAIISGKFDELQIENKYTNADKAIYLKQFKGIGDWTAQYILLKYFKDEQATMYGDAGINQILYILKGIPRKDSRKQQEDIYQRFSGFESYLTYYLWRHLSNLAETGQLKKALNN
jgi:DNA-3-methyladenine glycosylase II